MYCQQDQPDFQNQPTHSRLAMPTRICILGGGFGGLYTALYLRRFSELKSPNYQITLVEPREHFLFTPLLYEVITGELQAWEIAPSYQKLLANSNTHLCHDIVQDVDLEARRVYLQSGQTIAYDYLVLAVGGENRLDLVPGATTYAQPFRTLADAEHLKERLRFLEASDRPKIRVAIAGGGPNGVELACKLADRLRHRGQVSLIERGDQLLKSFTAGSRLAANRALKARNVQVHLNTSIEAIVPDHLTLNRHDHSYTLDADLVLWTAGTQMLEWVRNLSCGHNSQGQLVSLPTLQLTGYPEVFALGDLAEIQDAGKQRVPATAQAAYQQADCAARNVWRAIAKRPLLQFRYLHLGEMLTLGTNVAAVSSFGLTLHGRLAGMIRQWVYAQRLPTLRHRFQVIAHWIANGILKGFPRHWRSQLKRVGRSLMKRQRQNLYGSCRNHN